MGVERGGAWRRWSGREGSRLVRRGVGRGDRGGPGVGRECRRSWECGMVQAGKATVFRMCTGEEAPRRRHSDPSETVELGYVDRSREFDPDKTVLGDRFGRRRRDPVGLRRLASCALLVGEPQGRRPAAQSTPLPGGERNGVRVARFLRGVATGCWSTSALPTFGGCVAVIGHDLRFLGRVIWFHGNYQDYEAERRRRSAGPPTGPHRIKYRGLVRV